jgi:threonine efflux protein
MSGNAWHIMLLLASAHLFTVMSPGPNQALVVATAARNRRDGFIVAAGFWPAGCIWAAMGMLGMGELMRQIAWFEITLRVACGLYLIWLGLRIFRKAPPKGSPAPTQRDRTPLQLFGMGFLTNLGNAKAIAYFASVFAATGAYVLPWPLQFIAIFMMPGIGFAWNATVVLIMSSGPMKRFYYRFIHWFDRVSGSLLVLFGLKLLVAK